MKIRQRTIQNINALYPKIAILQSPSKKAFTSTYGLVRTIQTPILMPKDIRALIQYANSNHNHNQQDVSNSQSDIAEIKRILSKLDNLLQIWIKVIENNQKVRQQYQNNPFNTDVLLKYQKILIQFQNLSSKSEFVKAVGQHGQLIFNDKIRESLQTNYKQIYVINNTENYNTVSTITEDQYLSYQQNVVETIFAIMNFIPKNNQSDITLNKLQKLIQKIENSTYFTKSDNQFNKIVKYNATLAEELSKNISNFRKCIYSGNLIIRQSIFVCYYLCFIAKTDIQKIRTQRQAKQMYKYMCNKQDQIMSVFPILYQRKIKKNLIKLQQKESQLSIDFPQIFYQLNNKQDEIYSPTKSNLSRISQKSIRNSRQNQQNLSSLNKQVQDLLKKISELQYKYQNTPRPLQQKAFTNFYGPIQSFCCQYSLLQTKVTNSDDFQLVQKVGNINNLLSKLQSQVLEAFVHTGDGKRRIYVKVQNSAIVAQGPERMSMKSQKSKSNANRQSYTPQSIFQNSIDNAFQLQQQVDQSKLNQYINVFIYKNITPQFVFIMQDKKNYQSDYLDYLIRRSTMIGINTFDLEYLKIFRQSIKPSISQSKISKMFYPRIRHDLIQLYHSKMIEYAYKLVKTLNNIQSQQLQVHRKIPPNLLSFLKLRENYVRFIIKKVQRIMQVTSFLSNLQNQVENRRNFDIADNKTYQFILKLLIISKQLKAYQFSDLELIGKKGENNQSVDKATGFLMKCIYNPILATIDSYFKNSKSVMLYDLYDQAQKASDLVYQSEKNIEYYNDLIAEKQRTFPNKSEVNQILNPIFVEFLASLNKFSLTCDEILNKRNDVFIYSRLDRQKIRIQQYISVIKAINTKQKIDDRQIADSSARNLLNNFF